MNVQDLTVRQLKRAAAIKEQLERLNKELGTILGAPARSSGSASTKSRPMSAAVKRKIAASQRARWARLRRAKAENASAKTPKKSRS